MSTDVVQLKWTAQLKVGLAEQTQKLPGDKIILPPSALEQLLAAATVTVVAEGNDADTFDPFNPFTYAGAARSQVVERHQNLPHPLTFRLVNPENGNVVYAGVREFSAEEEEIGLSDFLRRALGVTSDDSRVTVHAQQLPKGKHVRFRPLEAGYDPDDWKALLERQLRHTFTTLTKGEVLTIEGGPAQYRFLVDEVQPEGDGICIVDTDLEVDIEALNEEQARETLQRRLAKSARPLGESSGSSQGGLLQVDTLVTARVAPEDYVDYELQNWDRSLPLTIEVESDDPVELFVSTFSSLQRERPRETVHELHVVSDRQKRIARLQDLGDRLAAAEALYVSVYNPSPGVCSFTLCVTKSENNIQNGTEQDHEEGDVRCKNCHQWVPQRTLVLHENFCYRNNVICPKCGQVFKKQSEDWKQHWHCEHDDGCGISANSKARHDQFFHQPTLCKACGYHCRSVADLALHQTSTCPEKQILCQFCHLIVPQQGPDDLDINDPEVLVSGLTPHELSDGATTTECHICSRIVRLRDMATHLRHHDLDRLARSQPRLCRNVNCGRTLDGVDANGQLKPPQPRGNDIGLCDSCFGPLYNSAFDPEHKALRRRVERRYMTQLLTGCGKQW